MRVFTTRVMRLLSEELTRTSLRDIDALFDDRGVALGPPQPRENDESKRRERMRRYLASLDLDDFADAQRLTASAPPGRSLTGCLYEALEREPVSATRSSRIRADPLRNR